ncbi:hypothetical protein BpHYR1_037229 [Brachionus plicatilis]|uniref:Uncharacterized protein n=1 Tax=Brachionus plicatilis TaxID=10195 RepID=A0A3M7PSD4_BRAPC|nr:hypothetical protein BpHYR1_037229 [Brachionus plicatilis]
MRANLINEISNACYDYRFTNSKNKSLKCLLLLLHDAINQILIYTIKVKNKFFIGTIFVDISCSILTFN